jgi:hypothetical protein
MQISPARKVPPFPNGCKRSRPLLTPDEAMRMKGARKNAQGMITEPGNMVIYVERSRCAESQSGERE